MQVVRIDDVAKEPIVSPLFTGRQVTRQALVTEAMSKYFSLGVVSFGQGVRNKFHTHSSDQVLIVTAGRGHDAPEKEQRQVALGDVIHIPAGEKHRHGATGDAAFAHLALTAAGSKTAQLED